MSPKSVPSGDSLEQRSQSRNNAAAPKSDKAEAAGGTDKKLNGPNRPST